MRRPTHFLDEIGVLLLPGLEHRRGGRPAKLHERLTSRDFPPLEDLGRRVALRPGLGVDWKD
jgi:hypothetical protein